MAEPRSGDDLAQLLMEKATGDEKILIRLIDDDIPDLDYEPLKHERAPTQAGISVHRRCGCGGPVGICFELGDRTRISRQHLYPADRNPSGYRDQLSIDQAKIEFGSSDQVA